MKEITKNRWKNFGYFWFTLVPLLAYTGISMAVSAVLSVFIAVSGMLQGESDIFSYTMDKVTDSSMFAGVIYAILGILVMGLWYYFGCKRKKLAPPKGVVTPVNIVIVFLFAFGMQYVISCLMAVLEVLLPNAMDAYIELVELAGLGEVTIFGILYGVILGPIAEELTFRGVTLYLAGKCTKRFWLANTFQAVLFGIFHMNLIQGIYAFVLGILLGWLHKRFRSIYACMGFHIFFNALSFGPLEWISGHMPESIPFMVIWEILMFGLTAACILLIWKRTERKKVTEGENNL